MVACACGEAARRRFLARLLARREQHGHAHESSRAEHHSMDSQSGNSSP